MTVKNRYKLTDRRNCISEQRKHKARLLWDRKTIGVYTITCVANGKVYVGSSSDLYQRICGHIAKLRSGKHPRKDILKDFVAYGESAFIFSLVATNVTIEAARVRESALIGEYTAKGLTYNIVAPHYYKPIHVSPRRVGSIIENTGRDFLSRLKRWMHENGKSVEELGEIADIRGKQLTSFMKGSLPCWRVVREIFRWTNGAIEVKAIENLEAAL